MIDAWKPATVSAQRHVFVNELGKPITISIAPAPAAGLTNRLTYKMTGPTSETENTITVGEARVLKTLLAQALGEE